MQRLAVNSQFGNRPTLARGAAWSVAASRQVWAARGERRRVPYAGGRMIRKVVPRLTSLSNSMRPPWRVMMPCTTDKPSPVPLSLGLVEKNGSKTFSRMISGIPSPCLGP